VELSEKKLQFQFTGRYFANGNPDADDIWFILHGQGQLSYFFSRKFESISSPERLLVFPEGLNRYYLEGYSGRVGAGWMTREDRETDIENYIAYLNSVYDKLCKDKDPKQITILGFSQGAATASRWVADGHISCKRLILWAGILPPDMNIDLVHKVFSRLELVTVYGLKDPYLNEDRKSEQLHIMKDLDVESQFITFDGGHDIDQETLKKLVQAIDNRR
jgi:predicted esterase